MKGVKNSPGQFHLVPQFNQYLHMDYHPIIFFSSYLSLFTAFQTSFFECTMDTSNSVCPKLNSYSSLQTCFYHLCFHMIAYIGNLAIFYLIYILYSDTFIQSLNSFDLPLKYVNICSLLFIPKLLLQSKVPSYLTKIIATFS